MKIYLLGFMGAGKSVFGKELAGAMELDFFDLDNELAHETGTSPAEFIRLKGESEFRQMESSCLKHLKTPESAVIATGGGTPCFYDNLEWMKKNGVSIYIKVPEALLLQRLQANPGERPMLQNKKGDVLKAHISSMLAEREKFYSRADLVINGEELNVYRVQELLEKLKKERE